MTTISKKCMQVGAVALAYWDGVSGTPLFLHGNPTPSFWWRSTMAPLATYRPRRRFFSRRLSRARRTLKQSRLLFRR
jgi:hypothetical protein